MRKQKFFFLIKCECQVNNVNGGLEFPALEFSEKKKSAVDWFFTSQNYLLRNISLPPARISKRMHLWLTCADIRKGQIEFVKTLFCAFRFRRRASTELSSMLFSCRGVSHNNRNHLY